MTFHWVLLGIVKIGKVLGAFVGVCRLPLQETSSRIFSGTELEKEPKCCSLSLHIISGKSKESSAP